MLVDWPNKPMNERKNPSATRKQHFNLPTMVGQVNGAYDHLSSLDTRTDTHTHASTLVLPRAMSRSTVTKRKLLKTGW